MPVTFAPRATAWVASLHVYPVKSLAAVECESVAVEPRGLADDRQWVVCTPDGRFLTQRDHPEMATIGACVTKGGLRLSCGGATIAVDRPGPDAPRLPVKIWRDRVVCRRAGAEAAAWLSARLGVACLLAHQFDAGSRQADPAFAPADTPVSLADGFPVLLANMASARDLEARIGALTPMSRFRANIVIEGLEAWDEDAWRRVAIGPAVLRVVKPCSRCVVTTVDQTTGQRSDPREPLRTLATFRKGRKGVMFGQNAVAETLGCIRLGDPVRVLERGPSNLYL
ncbi:hypothetical protein AA103196_0677 [Ameyamaea chiangmaiensis NBRC 103196]|uniref:MOSC domain-containing protein n=1 Tax=Ameyamaea chiangmaiensis TaxID=442969 RepID=UPI0021567FC6|nr:MOSC N-terminal beta barrel domain-containing protein [Ameyamaea chiangmaiensis]GBQ63719.1 hypothetical protein AA103196_0677 [Ameyamaea chiangmaiensis NBRC 103196]